jgi:hypothetical protein
MWDLCPIRNSTEHSDWPQLLAWRDGVPYLATANHDRWFNHVSDDGMNWERWIEKHWVKQSCKIGFLTPSSEQQASPFHGHFRILDNTRVDPTRERQSWTSRTDTRTRSRTQVFTPQLLEGWEGSRSRVTRVLSRTGIRKRPYMFSAQLK